ncbi:hypothetical protein CLV58_11454 [Spirosoma oryzae]|uniref:Uncharacterized protein n=1 Tax=Spirosoma oryzae TaxID=1469603 RepID=A0A2T0SPX8_9BACT|nr:hypothetical protein CLV58_11454 [Spirosoma oryzae]
MRIRSKGKGAKYAVIAKEKPDLYYTFTLVTATFYADYDFVVSSYSPTKIR